MEIETIEFSGLASALQALRLPFGKDTRSMVDFNLKITAKEDICFLDSSCYIEVDPNDLELLSTLIKRGDEHAKVLRGVQIYAKIKAPVYWWCEMETYRLGHERLSSESTMHIDCKGLSGEELEKVKSSITMGKELTKIDMFSYQTLRRIYQQRKDHRLKEWRDFCNWIEGLPFAKELITIGLNKE